MAEAASTAHEVAAEAVSVSDKVGAQVVFTADEPMVEAVSTMEDAVAASPVSGRATPLSAFGGSRLDPRPLELWPLRLRAM